MALHGSVDPIKDLLFFCIDIAVRLGCTDNNRDKNFLKNIQLAHCVKTKFLIRILIDFNSQCIPKKISAPFLLVLFHSDPISARIDSRYGEVRGHLLNFTRLKV